MNEIRCLRCSSLNAADHETCWLCGSELPRPDDFSIPPLPPASAAQPGEPGEEEAAPAERNESLPDWLASLRAQESPPAAAEEPEDDLPDWLRSFRHSEPAPEEEQPVEADDNSWLREFAAWAGEESPEVTASEDESLPAGDIEPRLEAEQPGALEAGQPGSAEAQLPPIEQQPESGAPEWLAEPAEPVTFTAEEPQEEPPAQSVVFEETAVPDEIIWSSPEPQEPEEPKLAFPRLEDLLGEEDSLEWLSGTIESEPALQAGQEAPPDGGEPAGARKDYLAESGEELPSEPVPLVRARMPGWLKEISPFAGEEEPELEEIEEEDEPVETEGPLAGVRGALPGSYLLAAYLPSKPYTSALSVSETQSANAALLEELIAQEGLPLPAVRTRKERPVLLFRGLISLLIVVVLSAVLLTGFPVTPQPQFFAPSVVSFHNFLVSLAAREAAPLFLVVVDYQPATAPEIQSVASGPLHDLVSLNAGIALVSSQPSGPLLAEQLAEAVVNWDQDSSSMENTVNLGFLPGGPTGVQSFVSDPRKAAPANFTPDPRNLSPWAQLPLEEIQQFDQFSALLILTDSLENGRVWIEQSQSAGVPTLLVSSAQAGPLLQPYIHSGQVEGMVSGLGGGVQYNLVSTGTPGIDQRAWSAYQVGMGLAAVLLLAGGLVQGMLSIFRRKKQS